MKVIDRRFKIRFIAVIVLILIVAFSISAAFFYFYTNKELGETYTQKIYAITEFKTIVIKDTLFIFIPPVIAAIIFIVITIILYTHRIVGPLVRIRAVTQQISEGDLDILIKFREKDAIKPLADALNNLALKYRERYSRLGSLLEEISKDTDEMYQFIEKGDAEAIEDKRNRILKKTEEIKSMLSGIKL
ncbi:MAG: HAMP domain-containing protein [Thermodesulfovibrionia bacterium]|nr:HAMP domain-containing protein [Thermodesulfovibrionia bacterium]